MNSTLPLHSSPIQAPISSFLKHCRCGRTWNVVMERGNPNESGCVRCSCDAELMSWSGMVVFNAFPADVD